MTATKTFTAGSHAFTFRASAVPTMRTDRLLDYLMSVGYSDADLTSFLKPVLQRWEEPAAVFRALKENGFKAEVKPLEKLLRGLFDASVKAWYEQVSESDEENTPARELADEVDYWNLYAKKFGKALMRVRALQHEGVVWFRLGDVAAVAEDAQFSINAADYIQILVKKSSFTRMANHMFKNTIRKTTKAVRLFTRRELHVIDDRSMDEGTRKGDWYVTQKGMEFIIGSAARKSKPAAAFLDHVLEVLHGRAENMVQHAEKKIAVRSPARQQQLKGYRNWEQVIKDRGANEIDANGEVWYHVAGMRQSEYVAANNIGKPVNDNLPDAVVRSTNVIREVTATLATVAQTRGKHQFHETIARAAGVNEAMKTLDPSAIDAFLKKNNCVRTPQMRTRK